MEKIITLENLSYFAYCNHKICKKPIKGIAISFFGLGGCMMFGEETEDGKKYAEKGILLLVPYQNPWAWMNRQTVDYTDELVDVLFDAYGLPRNTPIVSTGGSMGGLSAIVYTKYAKRQPVCCAANSPVCDLVTHYTERPDLPRTIYHAFSAYDCSFEEAIKTASPVHLINDLPDIPYYVIHGTADTAVNKALHSDRFVKEMIKIGKDIVYDEVEEMRHCKLDFEHQSRFYGFILSNLA